MASVCFDNLTDFPLLLSYSFVIYIFKTSIENKNQIQFANLETKKRKMSVCFEKPELLKMKWLNAEMYKIYNR